MPSVLEIVEALGYSSFVLVKTLIEWLCSLPLKYLMPKFLNRIISIFPITSTITCQRVIIIDIFIWRVVKRLFNQNHSGIFGQLFGIKTLSSKRDILCWLISNNLWGFFIRWRENWWSAHTVFLLFGNYFECIIYLLEVINCSTIHLL